MREYLEPRITLGKRSDRTEDHRDSQNLDSSQVSAILGSSSRDNSRDPELISGETAGTHYLTREIHENLRTSGTRLLVTKRDRHGLPTGRDLSHLRRNRIREAEHLGHEARNRHGRGTNERYDSRARDYLPNRSCKTVESG